ncbi:MAG TPA: hypothetical protein VHB21_22455 [Minicystis sp.]|nr:hypothetical protein [Minicystis sp.]
MTRTIDSTSDAALAWRNLSDRGSFRPLSLRVRNTVHAPAAALSESELITPRIPRAPRVPTFSLYPVVPRLSASRRRRVTAPPKPLSSWSVLVRQLEQAAAAAEAPQRAAAPALEPERSPIERAAAAACEASSHTGRRSALRVETLRRTRLGGFTTAALTAGAALAALLATACALR